MKNTSLKNFLIIILSPVLFVMGLLTTLVLLPFYPLLKGWIKGDGNQPASYPFLRFLWTTATIYLKK